MLCWGASAKKRKNERLVVHAQFRKGTDYETQTCGLGACFVDFQEEPKTFQFVPMKINIPTIHNMENMQTLKPTLFTDRRNSPMIEYHHTSSCSTSASTNISPCCKSRHRQQPIPAKVATLACNPNLLDSTCTQVEPAGYAALRDVTLSKMGKEISVDEDFICGKTVGTGTFGRVKVVKLRNHHDQTPFALKIINKSAIIKMRQSVQIKNEKELLLQLNHPFIVNLLATFQDSLRVYLVMEFVNGGELFTYLRNKGRMCADEAKFFAAEVLVVFEYLHNLNIAYRDLKPENVLIASDGHIKLTDFGFAKKIDRKTFTLCGTPEYLAPEIITSKGYFLSVDWWALGVLCYEMIAGVPPFYGNDPSAIYQKIARGKFNFNNWFNAPQEALISGLLRVNVEHRLGAMENGAKDVKACEWFKSIDWSIVTKKGLVPYSIPQVSSPDDTSQFDEYPDCTESKPVPIPADCQAIFRTFTSLPTQLDA